MAASKTKKSGRALGAGAGQTSGKHPAPKAQVASSGSRSKRQPPRARPASARASKPAVKTAAKPAAKPAKATAKVTAKLAAKPAIKKAQPKAAPKIEAADRDLGLPTTVTTRSTGQAARAVGDLRREMVAAAGASAVPRGAPPALPTPIATFTI